eukprot:1147087-Pelagomonas_calceolata.AAC.1
MRHPGDSLALIQLIHLDCITRAAQKVGASVSGVCLPSFSTCIFTAICTQHSSTCASVGRQFPFIQSIHLHSILHGAQQRLCVSHHSSCAHTVHHPRNIAAVRSDWWAHACLSTQTQLRHGC